MHFDDQLLDKYIHTYYGTGDYSARYWFVSMENGGGKTFDEVLNQITIWQELNEKELVDGKEFHIRMKIPEFFTDPVKIQRTWMQQARIVLASQGMNATLSDVKVYQRDLLGRKNGETCLLELLPLPSPNISAWNYNQWSDLAILRNRVAYSDYCFPWRCAHIRAQIQIYQPRVVVFNSYSYKEKWKQIAGPGVNFIDEAGVKIGTEGNTLFIITKHPTMRGISNAYFQTVGSLIKTHLQRDNANP
jgi:hypothetical protein